MTTTLLGKRKNNTDEELVFDVYENINIPVSEFLQQDEDNAIILFENKKIGINKKVYLSFLETTLKSFLFVPCIFLNAEATTIENFAEKNKDLIEEKFKEVDTDQDGYIDENEFKILLEKFGFKFNEKYVEKIIKKNDAEVDLKKNELSEKKKENINSILQNPSLSDEEKRILRKKIFNEYFENLNLLEESKEKKIFSLKNVKDYYNTYDNIVFYINKNNKNNRFKTNNIFLHKSISLESEQSLKSKSEQFFNISLLGFQNEKKMISVESLKHFLESTQKEATLKNTNTKNSFINFEFAINNPDYYTNLEFAEIVKNQNWLPYPHHRDYRYNQYLSLYFDKAFQNLQKVQLGLTDEQSETLTKYVRHSDYKFYAKINSYLHNLFDPKRLSYIEFEEEEEKEKEKKKVQNAINVLDNMFINVAPRTKEIIKVFRKGLSLEEGYYPAYLSTTIEPIRVQNFRSIFSEILIRPGVPYMPVKENENSEFEILLPRGVYVRKLESNSRQKSIYTEYVSGRNGTEELYDTEIVEIYLPPFNPNDPINIQMNTPNYNEYYEKVCKDYFVVNLEFEDDTNKKFKIGGKKKKTLKRKKNKKFKSKKNLKLHKLTQNGYYY
jgi:hypothetical protein